MGDSDEFDEDEEVSPNVSRSVATRQSAPEADVRPQRAAAKIASAVTSDTIEAEDDDELLDEDEEAQMDVDDDEAPFIDDEDEDELDELAEEEDYDDEDDLVPSKGKGKAKLKPKSGDKPKPAAVRKLQKQSRKSTGKVKKAKKADDMGA